MWLRAVAAVAPVLVLDDAVMPSSLSHCSPDTSASPSFGVAELGRQIYRVRALDRLID